MPIIRLTPHSCVDSIYSPGGALALGMAQLSNLVPAPDTANQWVPRPACVKYSASTADFVVAQIVVGNRLYGMRAGTGGLAGFDVPFCFDLLGNVYVSISGVTAANTPANAPTTGSWQPPHMEVIGTKIIVTHTGFDGTGANFFGVIETTNPGALTWVSSNTATNALPSVPVWVSQFNQRAFYYCNPTNLQPAILATDVLVPTTRSATVANFVLTLGDNVPLMCGGTLGVNNQLGGIVQALMVFKTQPTNTWQITGDFANITTSTGGQPGVTGQPLLTLNTLNVATGTIAPNSVTPTPKGLAFLAPDGWRIIDHNANMSDPIGLGGDGILVPFINAVQPTRVCAACNATTLRASTQNGAAPGSPQQEWCFDMTRGSWYGPHTFQVSLVSTYGNSFVITPVAGQPNPNPGFIWSSSLLPNNLSQYTENGAAYTCTYQSALLPEREDVKELSAVEATFYQGYGEGSTTYSISALDENSNVIEGGFAQLSFAVTGVNWGTFVWGSGQSLGGVVQIAGYDIPWSGPITFDRLSILVTVQASAGIRLGHFVIEYAPMGYCVGKTQPALTT